MDQITELGNTSSECVVSDGLREKTLATHMATLYERSADVKLAMYRYWKLKSLA